MPWNGPTSGLINRWPLDTANRSGATDADVVSADTGTESGTVALTGGPTGNVNSALSFDGTTSQISLASSPFDWATGSFSVGFWAYINNNAIVSPGGAGVSNQVYFNNDRNGVGSDYVIFANVAASPGQVRVSCSQTGLFSPAGSVPSATWTHVLFTNSGGGSTGTLALYINGVAVSTTPQTGDVSFDVTQSVFASGNPTHDGVLAGRLAQVVVYNKALSAAEAQQLYSAEFSAPTVTRRRGARWTPNRGPLSFLKPSPQIADSPINASAALTQADATLVSTASVSNEVAVTRRRGAKWTPNRGPASFLKPSPQVAASTVTATIGADAALTQADATLSATAALLVAATATLTQADATLLGEGSVYTEISVTRRRGSRWTPNKGPQSFLKPSPQVYFPDINVSAALTQADATLSATTALLVQASATLTQADATLSAAAVVPATATATLTQAAAALSATAVLIVGASAALTQANSTLSATSVLPVAATAALTQGDAALSAAATTLAAILADAALTQIDSTLSATAGQAVVSTGTGGGGVGGYWYSRKRFDEDRAARLALEEVREKRAELSAKAPKKALAKAIYAAEDAISDGPGDLARLTELLRAAASARTATAIISAADAAYKQAREIRAQQDDDDAILALILGED